MVDSVIGSEKIKNGRWWEVGLYLNNSTLHCAVFCLLSLCYKDKVKRPKVKAKQNSLRLKPLFWFMSDRNPNWPILLADTVTDAETTFQRQKLQGVPKVFRHLK